MALEHEGRFSALNCLQKWAN